MREMVELPQEFNGFKILPPAKLIWDPLPFFARVIEIKHRGHGINPQAVDVKSIAPEQGVCGQKVADFMPSKVENQRAPILMRSLTRVLMFIQTRAVKFCQRPLITR